MNVIAWTSAQALTQPSPKGEGQSKPLPAASIDLWIHQVVDTHWQPSSPFYLIRYTVQRLIVNIVLAAALGNIDGQLAICVRLTVLTAPTTSADIPSVLQRPGMFGRD